MRQYDVLPVCKMLTAVSDSHWARLGGTLAFGLPGRNKNPPGKNLKTTTISSLSPSAPFGGGSSGGGRCDGHQATWHCIIGRC
eukprot:scaffold15279_cov255-Alexandrium_tamarense.AAC.2